MPYMLIHFWPGATEANYQAELAAVHPPGGLPEGQTYHAAGPAEGCYLIMSIWDSKDSEAKFIREVLLPAQPVAGGFPNPVISREAPVVNFFTA